MSESNDGCCGPTRAAASSEGCCAGPGTREAVLEGYREAALQARGYCRPVQYDPELLRAIPQEVLDRDYGCGDPSGHVRRCDTVLDLGCGAGKLCFITAQLVGECGRVVGVDMNPEMLAVARRCAPEVADRLGFANVRFAKARIHDLRLDLDAADRYLAEQPIRSSEDIGRFEDFCARERSDRPVVPTASVSLILSNCVLNLVSRAEREHLFDEIRRVLKPGGRIAISDIVASEPVPEELQADPDLWVGCIAGAFEQSELLDALRRRGFEGVQYAEMDEKPWRMLRGVEFRSATVVGCIPDHAGAAPSTAEGRA